MHHSICQCWKLRLIDFNQKTKFFRKKTNHVKYLFHLLQHFKPYDFLPVKAVTLDFIWRMTGNKIGDSRLNIYRCFRHCCVKVQQPQSNAQMLIALFVIWRAPNPAFDQITTQSFKPCTPRNRTSNNSTKCFFISSPFLTVLSLATTINQQKFYLASNFACFFWLQSQRISTEMRAFLFITALDCHCNQPTMNLDTNITRTKRWISFHVKHNYCVWKTR